MKRQDTKDAKGFKEPDPDLDDLARVVVDAAVEVHRTLGPGYLESVYERRLIVELKAAEAIAPLHGAQVRSYLKATGLNLALLMNFNVPLMRQGLRRIVFW